MVRTLRVLAATLCAVGLATTGSAQVNTIAVASAAYVTAAGGGTPELPSADRLRQQLARRERLTMISGGRSTGEATGQDVAQTRTRGDSPWNGLLIGAALGALVGFSTFTDCEPVGPYRTCEGNLTTNRGMETAACAALFGAVGLTLDVFLDRSNDVPSAPKRRPRFSASVSPTRVQGTFRVAI